MDTPNQVLISEEGYEGKYVALRSMSDRTVIASGDDPETVMREAREQGIDNPVIFFVPSHDITLVYSYDTGDDYRFHAESALCPPRRQNVPEPFRTDDRLSPSAILHPQTTMILAG
jgi:hypothetical protein